VPRSWPPALHNTQPWRFRVADSFIELHIDPKRNVGALDPFLREEHLGMGCGLENLMLAARASGYAATTTLMPGTLSPISAQSQSELVARVDLAPGTREESELYNAIPRRHTNRSPYERQRPIPKDIVDGLSRLPSEDENVRILLFTGEAEHQRIVKISSAANIELYSDPSVAAASERWVRLQWKEVQRSRDGLTIDAFGLSPIAAAAAKTMPAQLLNRIASKSQNTGYADRMLTAPLIGFIAVRDRYDRAQCLRQAVSGSGHTCLQQRAALLDAPATKLWRWWTMSACRVEPPNASPNWLKSPAIIPGSRPLFF